ncbi:MAG: sugar phosphate isomerase/epimerase family protein [Armatimonadota bacterium]
MTLRGFSICNETWGPNAGSAENWPRVCADAKEAGYTGIELAPFTFAADCRNITQATRNWIKNVAADHGLTITALHWLLVSPPGLHIHTHDDALRATSTEYLTALAHLAVDVGADVMVLGSPKARTLENGDVSGAIERTTETLLSVASSLKGTSIRLCPEALPGPEADFILTQKDAYSLVQSCSHPNIGMMLDVKSMCSEVLGPAELIAQFGDIACHLHANDANRRGPGDGQTDFTAIAKALNDTYFDGWVSVEVFDNTPDAQTIAVNSLKHLRACFGAV